jgi:hypothetical protein
MTAASSDRRIRILAAILLSLIAATMAIRVWRGDRLATINDFYALWTYPVVARRHGAAVLYDMHALHAAQVALGMPGHEHNPFPYPPTCLLLFWPLGVLPCGWAWVAWMLTTLGLYLAAVGWKTPDWCLTVLLAALVPSSLVTLAFGQSGFLTAALIIGGMRLAWTRPVLGGVLLGLLTFKPQLGILVPVALASAGLWSCMLAAGSTAIVLVLASSAAFGWTIWLIWLKALPTHAHFYLLHKTLFDPLSPTVTANLQALGTPAWLASVGQTVAGLAAAGIVGWSFRKLSRDAALLTLCAATFLATPHALVYDMTMLGGAIILYRAQYTETVDALSIGKKAALVAVLCLPFLLFFDKLQLPVSSIILVGAFWIAAEAPTGRGGIVGTSPHLEQSLAGRSARVFAPALESAPLEALTCHSEGLVDEIAIPTDDP